MSPKHERQDFNNERPADYSELGTFLKKAHVLSCFSVGGYPANGPPAS